MPKRKTSQYPNNAEVRAWADERFFDVPTRGRLPGWVIEEWDKAHPVRKYVASEAYHGTLSGYTYRGCREECCESVWNEYQANYYADKLAA